KMPAQATENSFIAGNLDAALEPDGSIHQSEALFAVELTGNDNDIDGLYANGNANETISGMIYNSTTISFTYDGTTTNYNYVESDASAGNGSFNSLEDLVDEISNDYATVTVVMNASGQITFTNNAAADTNLAITCTNPILENSLFGANSADLAAGATATDEFSHVASETDLLTNLRNSTGQPLGLVIGDEITFSGLVGDPDDVVNPPVAISATPLAIIATTTYADYANAIKTAFDLSNLEGVEIDSDDGSLIINADAGRDYMISTIEILADDTPGAGGTLRAGFNSVFDSTTGNWDLTQEALDIEQSASVTIYDSLGKEYNLTLIFTKDVKAPNRWKWEADIPEPSIITGGETGTVEFNTDGSLDRFRYDGGASTLQFDPGGGGSAELMSVSLNAGESNSFEGLTQMTGAGSSLIIREQDGYAMGEMERIAIGEAGQITGSFTNGIIKTLGQIMLAAFNNPAGLLRTKDNMYLTSANTGTPIIAQAGGGVRATIRSGALEQSNVDLAEEFTRLIVAQRGFQAAARVITTSDTMLTEVTNLKR
ncbi:MAG: flagellar hook-basal body complex protein, partial [Calditrichia bacterium]|nr:flagellar hook-basal body complex protein [Calditrichia bacterium]